MLAVDPWWGFPFRNFPVGASEVCSVNTQNTIELQQQGHVMLYLAPTTLLCCCLWFWTIFFCVSPAYFTCSELTVHVSNVLHTIPCHCTVMPIACLGCFERNSEDVQQNQAKKCLLEIWSFCLPLFAPSEEKRKRKWKNLFFLQISHFFFFNTLTSLGAVHMWINEWHYTTNVSGEYVAPRVLVRDMWKLELTSDELTSFYCIQLLIWQFTSMLIIPLAQQHNI